MSYRIELLIALTLLLILGTSFLPTRVQASTSFFVNGTRDEPDANPGDGVCRSTPSHVCTLRAAIQESNALGGGFTIYVPTGTYTLKQGRLEVRQNVTIAGAGASKTVIDGNALDRLFRIYSSSQVSISGLTMRDGKPTDGFGGGAIKNAGSLTMSNAVIRQNRSISGLGGPGNGGGIDSSGSVTLTNVAITNNQADGQGGGIENEGGTLILINVNIGANVAQGQGGGIDNGGSLRMTNVNVHHNRSWYLGGGISSTGALTMTGGRLTANWSATDGGGLVGWDSTLTHVTIDHNTAGVTGGGINIGWGTLTLTNSIITQNTAGRGGGIESSAMQAVISGTAIIHNTAQGGGGGLENNNDLPGASAVLVNDTISDNTAQNDHGGGITNDGYLTLINVTLSANSAPAGGGGIYNFTGPFQVANTIVAGSRAGGNCSGSILSSGYNLSSDSSCVSSFTHAGDLNNKDPRLGPLQNNGGPTPTRALLAGSPAIDSGNPQGCTDSNGSPLVTDQRGMPRPDPEDNGVGCDIGAFERQKD